MSKERELESNISRVSQQRASRLLHQHRPIRTRASQQQDIPFHRAAHSSGIHPEDEPYTTDDRKT